MTARSHPAIVEPCLLYVRFAVVLGRVIASMDMANPDSLPICMCALQLCLAA